MSRHNIACMSVVVLVLFLYSLASVIRQYVRLRHIKGPLSAGFAKWWLVCTVRGGNSHVKFYEAHKKYGPLIRVGPNDVITSDPDLMKHMLNVRTEYKRSNWYDAMRFDPGRDNVLSERNNKRHTKLRSQMAAGIPCKNGGACRYPACCSGHICQNIDCKYRGGYIFCKIPRMSHGQSMVVDQYVNADTKLLDSEQASSVGSYEIITGGERDDEPNGQSAGLLPDVGNSLGGMDADARKRQPYRSEVEMEERRLLSEGN